MGTLLYSLAMLGYAVRYIFVRFLMHVNGALLIAKNMSEATLMFAGLLGVVLYRRINTNFF